MCVILSACESLALGPTLNPNADAPPFASDLPKSPNDLMFPSAASLRTPPAMSLTLSIIPEPPTALNKPGNIDRNPAIVYIYVNIIYEVYYYF
jgi:hypothetical protein